LKKRRISPEKDSQLSEATNRAHLSALGIVAKYLATDRTISNKTYGTMIKRNPLIINS